jgi:hypothetical protein
VVRYLISFALVTVAVGDGCSDDNPFQTLNDFANFLHLIQCSCGTKDIDSCPVQKLQNARIDKHNIVLCTRTVSAMQTTEAYLSINRSR